MGVALLSAQEATLRTTSILTLLVMASCGEADEPCTCPPGWMCLADGCAAICATDDDCDDNQACVRSLCLDSTPGHPLQGEEPPPEEPPPEEPPPPPPPPPDPDTDGPTCLAGVDQTIDSWPDDVVGDHGLVYYAAMNFESGDGACCGDDPDEWYLWQQGTPTVSACCDHETDCIDNDGVCYDSNSLEMVSTSHGTEEHVCYGNWWYACAGITLCITHYHRNAGDTVDLDFDCYFTGGEFVFGSDTAVPVEACHDGFDNDCDGDVDADDDECCGRLGQLPCDGDWCDDFLEPCYAVCLPEETCDCPECPPWELP